MSVANDLFPKELNPLNQNDHRPFVRILYDERIPGTIFGRSSTLQNKTWFTIEIVGYTGRVVVVVSCVTQIPPYKPHPHCLSGPYCKKGHYIFRTEVTVQNPRISFPKLAVERVKRSAARESLRTKQKQNIDPFKTGFDHCNDAKSIDLNGLRLCVQVFLKGEGKDIVGVLTPIVSEPIYEGKVRLGTSQPPPTLGAGTTPC